MALRLAESGRVEDYRIVPLPPIGALAQQVEGVGLGERYVGEPVERGVGTGGLECVTATVHGLDRFGIARGMQGKSASIRKDVENTALRVRSSGEVILSLVEKNPGLLARPQLRSILNRALPDDDKVGDLTRKNPHARRYPFLSAGRRVTAEEDARGGEKIFEGGDDLVQ